jgi:hypothetical protein
MAATDDLIAQAAVADTTDQLDAIQAQSQDPGVSQAVQNRRTELNTRSVTSPRAAVADEPAPDKQFGVTEPEKPKEHYFVKAAGKKVNAWGEEKGSPEDKKRW